MIVGSAEEQEARINQDQKDEVETLIAMFSEEKWWATVGKGLDLMISSYLGFTFDANVIEAIRK